MTRNYINWREREKDISFLKFIGEEEAEEEEEDDDDDDEDDDELDEEEADIPASEPQAE